MENKNRSPLGMYTVGIAALFLAGFLLLVIFGARSYGTTVSSQSGNAELRSLTSYFWTVLKANDARDAVEITETGYGTMLSVYDNESDSVIRIYAHDGKLMEAYLDTDMDVDPEDSEIIGDTQVFSAEFAGGRTLRITTDEGTVLVTLRPEGGRK